MTDLQRNTNTLSVVDRHKSAFDQPQTIYRGSGNDLITTSGSAATTVYAGEGNNVIQTGSGRDMIYAGAGNDVILAGDGRNIIYAGEGRNQILTGNGRDLIYSGAGNDVIFSGGGNDLIYAGEGNNTINAGTGDDTVYIGSGKDQIILESGAGAVTVIGFNVSADKLRLGSSLAGKVLKFAQQGGDTIVKSGDDLVAVLKYAIADAKVLASAATTRYQVTDLGSLSSNVNGSVNAASINDFGQIAGRYDTGAVFANTNATTGANQPNNLVRQGFIWENGVQTALTSKGVKVGQSNLGAANGTIVTLLTPNVNTISNAGSILGTADEVRQPIPKATDRALLWQQDDGVYSLSINDFGGLESYFFDTNDEIIVGRNIKGQAADPTAGGFEAPIYWDNGNVITLANLGGDGGTARGINTQGQIVGYTDKDGKLDDAFTNTAILWERDGSGNYQSKNLGTFGAAQATLRDINDAGQIIGATSNGLTGDAAASTPFLFQDGTFTGLGSLGGKTGSVNGINQFGQIVGASQTADKTNHAYIWDSGKLVDLNDVTLAPITYNGAKVTLTSATSVNNFGDIIATGTYTYKDAAGKDATGTRSFVLKVV